MQKLLRQSARTLALGLAITLLPLTLQAKPLELNEKEYFETQGLNVIVFSNWYNGLFGDSKISGIEIIHHGVRTATNGDVRLSITPEQWDAVPTFIERKIDKENGVIEAFLSYPNYDFKYSIHAQATPEGLTIKVNLPEPLPAALVGKAGFNLEFLPSSYFEKSFLIDGKPGLFPRYPTGPKEQNGKVAPTALAQGNVLVLAPADPARRVVIESNDKISLYDGRGKAQNGWYVVRGDLPAGKTGDVLTWKLKANTQKGWLKAPVIAHSQVGYHPQQNKVAVIELDKNDRKKRKATLFKINAKGEKKKVLSAKPKDWGQYKRYNYRHFDFSNVREEGIYVLQYGKTQTAPFMINKHVYDDVWHATLDVYFPVQMDHVLINEGYRVWHGASHLDDALQAPVDHKHFDLYAQGPTTDTKYKPGEHIPGLNIGGWYDAGDYDIRTQTQYITVSNLVSTWETFKPMRDTTLVDYDRKYVDIHVPDGKPDILQQIEHGTLALIAQHRALGRAIPGIIVSDISQYTHLGDGLTMTDNLIYNAEMDELESNGFEGGKFDDRWAFTSRTTALNYGSAAALAAASRALRGYNDKLAEECFQTAVKVWNEEQTHEPYTFRFGNTTGGGLVAEQLRAALELLVTTGDKKYAAHIKKTLPEIEKRFGRYAILALRALPYMDEEFKTSIATLAKQYALDLTERNKRNPYNVVVTEGGWAGNGRVIGGAITHYYLHKAYPELFDKESVFSGLNYLYGTHPGSDISFVSSVGTHSKTVAYGMNRADFSFIAGGIVPGVLMLKPDFPENKEDWPFLWGENEYVINIGAIYLFLSMATNELLEADQ